MTALPLCPDCGLPMDPAAAPRHPVHDFTAEELATMRRGDEARQARTEERRMRELREQQQRADRARRRTNRRRTA